MQAGMQCPVLWVDREAVDVGVGMLQVVYRLGGSRPRHCPLPIKPLKLQPVKHRAGGPAVVACKAYVSGKVYTQLYRLVVGLFPKLDRLHQELCTSPVVQLTSPCQWEPGPSGCLNLVRASPIAQVSLRWCKCTGTVAAARPTCAVPPPCLLAVSHAGAGLAAGGSCWG